MHASFNHTLSVRQTVFLWFVQAANIGAITGSGDDQDKNGTEVHTIADSDEEPASPTQSLSGLRDQLQTGTGDSRVRRRLQQAEPDMQPDEGMYVPKRCKLLACTWQVFVVAYCLVGFSTCCPKLRSVPASLNTLSLLAAD